LPWLATTSRAAKIIIRKPTPARKRPSENLAGLERSFPRRPMATQSAAKTGASRMMEAELMDWNQVAGTSKEPIWRWVKSLAKRLSEVGACSKALQKIAANTNS